MSNKEVIQLTQDLGIALSLIEKAYLDYISAVKNASSIAEELKLATNNLLSKPHIDIEDFEIDN